MIPYHINCQFKNTTQLWSGSDQEERYLKNLSNLTKREILEKLGWTKSNCITYSYNSHGFRNHEFDNRTCGLAFGCSFTEGVGVDKTHSWPDQLSNLTGLHFWNLGIGGCAMDTVFRIFEFYIDLLNPKIVILLKPPRWRVEYADDKDHYEIESVNSDSPDTFLKKWFTYDVNSELNTKKNYLALKTICQERSLPFFAFCPFTDLGGTGPHDARDLAHPGIESHRRFAKNIYNFIDNKY